VIWRQYISVFICKISIPNFFHFLISILISFKTEDRVSISIAITSNQLAIAPSSSFIFLPTYVCHQLRTFAFERVRSVPMFPVETQYRTSDKPTAPQMSLTVFSFNNYSILFTNKELLHTTTTIQILYSTTTTTKKGQKSCLSAG